MKAVAQRFAFRTLKRKVRTVVRSDQGIAMLAAYLAVALHRPWCLNRNLPPEFLRRYGPHTCWFGNCWHCKIFGAALFKSDGISAVGSAACISGKVAYAVMSFGGFLGIGEDYYPMPWTSLKYDTNLGGYRVGVTEDQLTGAPKFNRNTDWDWSDRARDRPSMITIERRSGTDLSLLSFSPRAGAELCNVRRHSVCDHGSPPRAGRPWSNLTRFDSAAFILSSARDSRRLGRAPYLAQHCCGWFRLGHCDQRNPSSLLGARVDKRRNAMSTIVIIILILLLIGALPTWPYSSGWGYYPGGVLGIILIIVIILALIGRI